MFVSVFCFVMSITLLCLYICGIHRGSSSWVTLVSGCDCMASPLPGITGRQLSPLLLLHSKLQAGAYLQAFLFFPPLQCVPSLEMTV